MPIINQLSFNSYTQTPGLGLLFLNPEFFESNILFNSVAAESSSDIIFSSTTEENNNTVDLLSNSNTSNTVEGLSTFPYSINFDLIVYDQIELNNITQMNAVAGNISVPINPDKFYLTIIAAETFPTLLEHINLRSDSRYHNFIGDLNATVVPSAVHIITMTGTDGTGPRIFNEVPSSGSSFISPAENITFDLVDQEQTTINPVTIQIYVNGTKVVNSGIALTVTGLGAANLQLIAPYFYSFTFDPIPDFSLGSTITVSGESRDIVAPSGNFNSFNYSYLVWDTAMLGATISGSPDINAPYLVNQNPAPVQGEVATNSNVIFDIVDDHTGLNPASVNITLDGILVVSGGIPTNLTTASTTISSVNDGKGRNYIIDPVTDFNFFDTITVDIEAEDLFAASPNILNTSYYFTTVDNSHLLASGLQIYNGISYEDLLTTQSFNSVASGTDFKIKFYNFDNTGISISGSYITNNGILVSGISIVAVSGLTEYDVFFSLVPDYLTDADLIFHVEQIPLVSGNEVYKEFNSELLWGGQFCYDPDTNLTYDTEFPIVVQVLDKGDTAKLTSSITKFKTLPHPKNDLYASIFGLPNNISQLMAEVLSNNPYYEYGKEMVMNLTISDFAGNQLIYTWTFKIQENPNT